MASRSLSLSVVWGSGQSRTKKRGYGNAEKKDVGTHQHAEAVQQLGGVGVDAAAVLELAKLVQAVDVVEGDAVAVLEVLQVLGLVGAQVGDDALVVEQLGDLGGGGLELVALAEDLLALLGELGGHVVEAVDVLVQLAHEVGHVGGAQQGEQQALLLGRLLGVLVAGEVEQREQQMAVEVGHEARQQAVLLGDGAARGRCVGHGCGSCAKGAGVRAREAWLAATVSAAVVVGCARKEEK